MSAMRSVACLLFISLPLACSPATQMTRSVDRTGSAVAGSVNGLKDCAVGGLTGERPINGSVMLNFTISDDGSKVKARPGIKPECP